MILSRILSTSTLSLGAACHLDKLGHSDWRIFERKTTLIWFSDYFSSISQKDLTIMQGVK